MYLDFLVLSTSILYVYFYLIVWFSYCEPSLLFLNRYFSSLCCTIDCTTLSLTFLLKDTVYPKSVQIIISSFSVTLILFIYFDNITNSLDLNAVYKEETINLMKISQSCYYCN